MVIGILVFSPLVVGVLVYLVVDSLLVSSIGVVSFGSVLLDFIVASELAFLVVVVVVVVSVVVGITDLEYEHKFYELIVFTQCKFLAMPHQYSYFVVGSSL